jgi:hypothetical protein
MQHIYGNTFPVREHMKKLGGVWNKLRRCWDVADDRADEARRIVQVGPTAEVLFTPRPTMNGLDMEDEETASVPEPAEPVYVPPLPCSRCGWQGPNAPTLAYDPEGRPESLCCRCLPPENLHFSPGVSQ